MQSVKILLKVYSFSPNKFQMLREPSYLFRPVLCMICPLKPEKIHLHFLLLLHFMDENAVIHVLFKKLKKKN